ncbi:hypothetical protein V6N13_084342 [Hibiscus sabdariffa]|uniref:Uncharacterized protein n=1 Tax=Hibiscus sabdariffa TaxID=183260 RepID=A0ABR2T0Q8_9ROSI
MEMLASLHTLPSPFPFTTTCSSESSKLELAKTPKGCSKEATVAEDEYAKVQGTGSGFTWDKFDHIAIRGLGGEITAIREAIQTDAATNSGRPLFDPYGHVIGAYSATFTRKGENIQTCCKML